MVLVLVLRFKEDVDKRNLRFCKLSVVFDEVQCQDAYSVKKVCFRCPGRTRECDVEPTQAELETEAAEIRPWLMSIHGRH